MLLLGSMIAIGPLTVDTYLPALPQIGDDLAASDSAVQLTLTGMLLGLGIGQLVVGPLSDSFGRRRPLIAGLCAHAGASILCALAPTIAVLAVVRVMQGLSCAAVAVVAVAIVRDLLEGVAVARMMSRLMLVMGLAPILAPSLGSLVLTFTSWRGIFIVLAGIGVLLIALATVGIRETLPVERRQPATISSTLSTYRTLANDRMFVALTLIGGLMMAGMFAYVAGASFVLQEGYGLDSTMFGLVFGMNAVVLVLTCQLNPLMLRVFSVRQVLSGALVAEMAAAGALLVAALTGWGGLAAVIICMALVVSTAALAFPNTPALALSDHGDTAGTAAAVLGCVQYGLGGLVAPLVGAFGSATAAPMAAVMLCATGLAVILMFGVVHREARPAQTVSHLPL
ncbi:multidrug effflux MFS transporter [Nocardioides immobilis]|uniref:multidrug effflux MFS transporter n=1 Tax=Nocardioides immobilis TaxID=2049295 RepID=UPI001FEC9F9B|nr:multidrug effflux MFS transporter [Nocardioides immobilis]